MSTHIKLAVLYLLGSTQFQAPTSYHTEKELGSNWWNFFGFSAIVTGISVFVGPVIFATILKSTPNIYNVWVVLGAISYVPALWLVPLIFGGYSYRRRRVEILARNEDDYVLSQRLNTALEPLLDKHVTEYPITEPEIGKPMHPFRIEHHLSSSMRGGITGSVQGSLLFGKATLTASMHGLAIPNLVDSSVVLFLTDGEETMRVLLPSPTAVREMMAKIIEAHSKQLPYGCHARGMIERFALDDDYLTRPVSHPQLVDRLNVKCEKPLSGRPNVVVLGYEIQPGVVLASALVVDDERRMFLPTGFYEALTRSITSVTELEANVPEALAIADYTT